MSKKNKFLDKIPELAFSFIIFCMAFLWTCLQFPFLVFENFDKLKVKIKEADRSE